MQLTAGYIIAPHPIHLLPKMLAGEIMHFVCHYRNVGSYFGCSLCLFFRRQLASLLVGFGALALLACNHLLVTPVIEGHNRRTG